MGAALAIFSLVWLASQPGQEPAGLGLVQETESSQVLGAHETVEELNQVAGDQRSPLQAELVGPGVQDEPELEGAEWCTGEVVLLEGTHLYPGAEVVGKGGLWEDGTDERRASVASDGSFRVAFAPGTYRGTVKLEARGLNAGRNGVWRPWHSEPMYLYPYAGTQAVLHVVDEGPEPKGEIRVQQIAAWNIQRALREAEFVPSRGEGVFDCYQPGSMPPNVLVTAEGRAPVIVTPKYQPVGEGDPIEVKLNDSARLSGRVVCSGGSLPASLWLGCDQPFRFSSDGGAGPMMGVALEKEDFQIEVPAGIELNLRAGAKGHSEATLTVPPLEPGETRGGVLLEPAQQPGLKGRIVDSKGQPIVGAHIQSLVDLRLGGGGANDPGKGTDLRAVSDEEGGFELLGMGAYSEIPIEVTVPADPGFQMGAGAAWQAGQGSQHYEHVSVSSGKQTLVYAPKTGGLKGRVLGPNGQPLSSYSVILTPVGHRYKRGTRSGRIGEVRLPRQPLSRDASALYDHDSRLLPFVEYGHRTKRTYVVEDTDGRFEWPILPPGKWTLQVLAQGYNPTESLQVSLPRREALEIRIPKPASLAVSLEDDLGQPWIAQSLILARSRPGDLWYEETSGPLVSGDHESDADGLVHFSNLAPGTYEIRALGTHNNLLSARDIELLPGEEKSVSLKMVPFGAAKVALVGAHSKVHLTGRVCELDSRDSVAHASDRGRGLFFPELELGEYELKFGVVGGGASSEPLVPGAALHIDQRTITDVSVQAVQGMCSTEGRVFHNGRNPGAGRLQFVGLSKPVAVTSAIVDTQGYFHAFFPRNGEYRVVYTNKKNRAMTSHTQLDVPPGHSTGTEIRVQTGTLILGMRANDGVDPVFLTLGPDPIWLEIQRRKGRRPTKIRGAWKNGEAVFKFVPAGEYSVAQVIRGSMGNWRVIPGQTVVMPADTEHLQATVLAEPLSTLAGVCRIDMSEPRMTVNLRVWADSDLKVLVREQAFRVAERAPFLIRGVTIGKVWVTVGRVFRRSKAAKPGDPKRPVFGPFLVPEDGLVGLDLEVGIPR